MNHQLGGTNFVNNIQQEQKVQFIKNQLRTTTIGIDINKSSQVYMKATIGKDNKIIGTTLNQRNHLIIRETIFLNQMDIGTTIKQNCPPNI